MKKIIITVMLASMVIVAAAGIAHGAAGDSTYLTAAGSPHGGYITTSKKCGVCHAVHNAWSGELLLKSTAANACTYCHISTGTGETQIYAGVATNYTAASKKAHDSAGSAPCTGCHQVHAATGAMTENAYLSQKILKLASDYTGAYEATPASGDGNDVAVTKWCTGCHSYYNTGYDGTSHVMTTATANHSAANPSGTYAGRVSNVDSTTCRLCHDSGETGAASGAATVVTNSFPHYTTGERFLDDDTGALTADSEYDGVCLKCHEWTSGTVGVGITY
jgi:predicted CXXCH cytochrome family protein